MLKIGIIGFDTSHVTALTDLLNNKENPYHVDGAKVTAGFPGGSPDMPLSIDRIDGFTKTLVEKHGVEIKKSIEEMIKEVDAVLLESVDGRVHLKQFEKIASYKKPVFIDKPFTCSLSDAKKIRDLSEKYGTPVFSSSAVRYDVNFQGAIKDKEKDDIIGAETYGPAAYADPIPGLFWYGVHSAEMLFAAMGCGCAAVRCAGNKDTDIVIGEWKDGRFGILRGIRKGKEESGAVLFREKNIQSVSLSTDVPYYAGLMKEIMKFFQTGKSPVSLGETLEIIAFLENANISKKTGKRIDIIR